MAHNGGHAWPIGLAAIAFWLVTGCHQEPWTIECLSLSGPVHRDNAIAIADVLRSTPGVRTDEVYVRHDDDASTVYYGRYERRIDSRTGARKISDVLRADMKLIQTLVDDRGRRLFIGARMVPEPLPNVGPPEWNLTKADGEYTLQVAVFFRDENILDHKQVAVDYCAALRKKGYQAYYHHGDASSVVTVGLFGEDAVSEERSKVRYIQVPGEDGPETRSITVRGYSDEVLALQRKESFAYNLTNGNIWYTRQDGRRTPVQSALVRLPGRE
ncbi:MAG: hypothetical protein IID39_05315 [Planctomycetes bacterium]|nr:hypothetical protein [Planctomycetota bacterium]